MGLTTDEPVGAPDLRFAPTSLAAARRIQRQPVSHDDWLARLPAARTSLAEDGQDTHSWRADAPEPKRSVTLEQLLTWAYADQRVHRYLRRPVDWFLWALDDAGLASRAEDRRPVHHDAALVHEAVMSLGENLAHLIFHCAATGERPERPTEEPQPVPIEPWGAEDDFGVHEFRDAAGELRRSYYMLRTAEFVLVDDGDEWTLDGRKKMKRGRPRRRRSTRVAVQYAPIAWDPDQSYIEMCNQMADQWDEGLAWLQQKLAGAALRAHVLVAG